MAALVLEIIGLTKIPYFPTPLLVVVTSSSYFSGEAIFKLGGH